MSRSYAADMGIDVLMVILVIGFYLFAALLVAWLDRV